MNRKLIVTLLQKDIQELGMITDGFMEMNEYPKAIILLAQRKTEDIQSYFKQLADLKSETIVETEQTPIKTVVTEVETKSIQVEPISVIQEVIETNTENDIQEEIETALEFTTELIDFEAEITPIEETPEKTIEFIIEKPIEVIEEKINEPEKEQVIEEPRKTFLNEKIAHVALSRNELLAKGDNTLGNTLAQKKISDIKQAISIGDRFRFQRELFNSNGEDMNKTLNYINQLATFDEVQSFLESKYKWTAENDAVEDFYQIVRRKF